MSVYPPDLDSNSGSLSITLGVKHFSMLTICLGMVTPHKTAQG